MTFPGTDLANSAFGPYDPERAAVLRRYLAEEWAIRSVTTVSLDPVDVCEVVLPAIDGMNALAGLDPAKLAALLAACDRYTIGPAPDGCGFCREGNCSATAHVAITAALAELRGDESRAIDQSTIKPLQAERDALAAELAELKAAATRIVETWDAPWSDLSADLTWEDEQHLRTIAAQPQGERGAQILKRRDWFIGRLMAMNTVRLSQGLLSAEFLRLWELTLNELAAIDGAQP